MTVLIFDFDDTLIESRRDRRTRLLQALEAFGHEPDQSQLATAWGLPFRSLVLQLCPALSSRYPEFLHFYAERLQQAPPRPCAGVLDAIPLLARTATLFVHTASSGLLARTDLQSLGILTHFDFVCGSEWQRSPKPDPRSLDDLLAMIAIDRSRERVVYVGDSPTDAAIADHAGIVFVAAMSSDVARAAFSSSTNQCSAIADMRELLDLEVIRNAEG